MNKFFRFLIGLVSTAKSFDVAGQVVAMQLADNNILYLCEQNRITIAAEGIRSSSLRVTTNNGTIIPAYPSGNYVITPDSVKPTRICVDQKLQSGKFKRLSEQYFRVKYPPLSEPYLLSVDGNDTITRNRLYMCDVTTDIQGFVSITGMPVTGFTLVAKRREEVIFRKTANSKTRAHIDTNMRKFFYRLLNNDSLIFSDVTMRYCNGRDTTIAGPVFGFVIMGAQTEDDPYKNFEKGEIVNDPITGEIYERVTPLTNRIIREKQ